jgi:hypothetical protein
MKNDKADSDDLYQHFSHDIDASATAAYQIEDLNKKEYATLCWLSDHGYDGGILDLADGEVTEEDGYKFKPIPENVAWQIAEKIEEDPHAFLASNGSRSLGDKLMKFLDDIV